MNNEKTLNILHIDSSGRYEDSATRKLSQYFVDQLREQKDISNVTQRDVAKGLPFVDEPWINAAHFASWMR